MPAPCASTPARRWLDRRESKGAASRTPARDRSRWKLHVETAPFGRSADGEHRLRDVQRWIHALDFRRATDRHRKGKGGLDLAVDGAGTTANLHPS